MKLLQDFYTDEENINAILLEITNWVLIGIIGFILIIFRQTFKKIIINLLTLGKNQFNKLNNWLNYKRTIKLIVKKKIPVTDKFLLGKSPKENRECAKIFRMLDSGELESPPNYKSQKKIKKLLEEHPELKDLKIDLSKLPDVTPKIKVEPLKIPKDFR